jgi:hypothetical protein
MKQSFRMVILLMVLFLSACSNKQAANVKDVPQVEGDVKSNSMGESTEIKANKNTVRNVFSLALDEGIWLARIVPSQEKDVFFAIGFSNKVAGSPYQIYKISNTAIEKLVELTFNTSTINNPYYNIDNVRFINLIGNSLFIGVYDSIVNNANITVIDTSNPHQVYKSTTLKDQKEAQLVLDNIGNSYVFSLNTNQSIFMQQITKDGEVKEKKDLGEKSSGSFAKLQDAIYHKGFFFLALTNLPEYTQSTLMQFGVDGSLHKSIVTDEMAFKMLPSSRENIMVFKSGELENVEAYAVVYTSDLAEVETFKIPSFYEMIVYQGTAMALSNKLLFIEKKFPNYGDIKLDIDKNMDIMRYSAGSEPSLLVRIKNDERPSAGVVNLTNAFASSNKFYVGVTEMTQAGEKTNSFFNLYEINVAN